MKRTISLLLILAVVFLMAACGSEVPNPTNPEQTQPATSPVSGGETQPATEETVPLGEGYTFTYGNAKIAVHADAAPIVAALGEAMSFTQEESCAFEGIHKTYYYGSFYLQTYPDGNVDRVYRVWLVDDSVATEENIYIGAPQAAVENAYGAQWYNGKNAYIVKSGGCVLTIILDGGVVSSIQYMIATE